MTEAERPDDGETREIPLDELILSEPADSGGVLDDDSDFSLGPRQPVIGEYVLLGRIGAGGNGRVFVARHRRMERLVALKMLAPASMRDPEAVRRFRREMKAAAKLFHPNIVTAFDAGESDGMHYLVMEYIEGQSLAQVIEQHGPLPVAKAIDYVLQAARGLQYAHSRDVIHRDIKPNNLILDAEGRVKILDMGTARFQNETPAADLTQAGVIMGTVNYMSPEQARAASDVDHRTDIYSLGCTLYYLLVGRSLFDGNVMQVLLAHAEQPPPPVARSDMPPWLQRTLRKMLAKRPDDRQQSLGELIAELEDGGARGSRESESPFFAAALRSGAKSAPARAVGVDLGAAGASLTYLDDTGRAVTISVDGTTRMPAQVSIHGLNISVGKHAGARGPQGARPVATRVRRHLGEPLHPQTLDDAHYPPEVLQALMLCQLAGAAREQIGDFREVVITGPAMSCESQRKLVSDVGYIAGLEVADVVSEPTAALLSLGRAASAERVLLLDLGASKLDIAVATREQEQVRVEGVAGDARLGGFDWDDRLLELLVDQAVNSGAPDPRDVHSLGDLRRVCEQARIQLSGRAEATIALTSAGQRLTLKVPRERLELMTADLLQRVVEQLGAALRLAGRDWGAIGRVVLSGQAGRMPSLLRAVQLAAGRRIPCDQLAPEAVSQGAALHAGALLDRRHGRTPRVTFDEPAVHSVGLVGIDSNGRRCNGVVIPRGARLPATAKRTFRTRTGAEPVLVEILQGEGRFAEECVSIGRCVINDLPPGLAPGAPVEIELQYAPSGRLTLFVAVPSADYRAAREISHDAGLSNLRLSRWREWVETIVLCSNL